MIIPETGGILNVVGSRRAIAAKGPMPGRTPTNVPNMVPMKQYKRFIG
jgi:hypothetical protein